MSQKSVRTHRLEQLEDRRCCAVASVGWDGAGKGSADLTYFIGNTPASLNRAAVESAIKTALDAWSNVADIEFIPTNTPGLARSLDFTFGNIDGSGGTLAQAYLPSDVNSSRIAGDVKFDSSEKWEIGNALGSTAFDLVRVAVHEIGHSLGLDHSKSGSAILAPSVSANEYFTKLDPDDVDAILSLYAPAKTGTATTPTNNSQPSANTPTLGTPKINTASNVPSRPLNPNQSLPRTSNVPNWVSFFSSQFRTRTTFLMRPSILLSPGSFVNSWVSRFSVPGTLTDSQSMSRSHVVNEVDGTPDTEHSTCQHSTIPLSLAAISAVRSRFRF
jgi:hypothetical protein